MKKKILTAGLFLSGLLALASCNNQANNESSSSATLQESTSESTEGNSVGSSEESRENQSTTPELSSVKVNVDSLNENDKLDYIKTKYGISNHVYDVITIDRLNLLLDKTKTEQFGDSVIVFANSESETSKAAIVKINEEAIKLGIKRIYYFDFLLAGEYGVDLWDSPETTWPNVKTGDGKNTQVTQAFVNAKNYLLNNTSLSSVSDDYDADNDVYLFVNRHQSGTSEILSSLLIENKNDINVDEIKTVLNVVINGNGQFTGTNYSDYDYFNNPIYRSSATNSYYPSYEEFKNNFNVRSITYYELRLLLETEGDHNILFSGSWCGDSKAVIALVVENKAKFAGEPVYVFDFRLTNGVSSSNQTSVVEAEGNANELVNAGTGRNFITGVGFLGNALIEKLGNFEVGKQNSQLSYVKGGYENLGVTNNQANVEYGITTQKKFRSPSLFKYNKDEAVKVKDSWVHTVTEYDIPHASSTYAVGDLIDYELSSGTLSEQQKAYGKYQLALFLGEDDITYSVPSIKVSETPSDLDSGCGDDNDPIDNLRQSTLIPNHGTNSYDVKNYDIKIELIEGNLATNAIFKGETKVTATAKQAITNQLSIDFRRQKIEAITLKNITKNVVLLDNVTGDLLNSSITRVNNDDEDLQKLYVKFTGSIDLDDEFELIIKYETTTIDNSTSSSEYGQFAEGFNVHKDNKGYTAVGEPFGSTYWFPNNNTPSDGAKYRITLIAPSGYTLISSGVRESNSINSETGKRETVWVISQDTATYQVFATFSKNITTFEQSSGTRSQTLFETKDGKKIPIYIYVNNDIYKENRYKVERFIGLLPQYIKTLEELFGSYQGESLGFIFENVGDGHGESATWGAIETKDRPFFTNTSIVGENTFVHEFVHQWYGDAVRIENWDNLWLNEGFATYGTSLFYEEIKDDYSANSTYKNLYDSKNETSKLWEKAPAALELESDLFGGQKSAYNRGALALDILRNGIGDDAFFDIIKTWISEYKGTARTTEDFIALVKSKLPNGVSESDIDSFKNVWLYGTAKPANYTLTGSNS